MAITLSKLNRFSTFFHRWKEEQIISKTCIICPTTLKVSYALPVENLSLNLRQIANVVFDESKKNLVIQFGRQCYCQFYKSCSKCPPFAHIHARRRLQHHPSIASSMTLWSMACQTSSKRFFSSSMLCSCD